MEDASLKIYDTNGVCVQELHLDKSKGIHKTIWSEDIAIIGEYNVKLSVGIRFLNKLE